MARKKLGEMLVEAGVLSDSGLNLALNELRRWGGTLGRTVVELKLVSEAELVRVLAKQLNLPTVDLDRAEIPRPVLDLIPAELAQQHVIVPFAQPMKFLDVAMADPTNLGLFDELRIRTQLNVRPHLAGPKMLERAIAKHYGRGFGSYVHRPEVAIPIETADVGELLRPRPQPAARDAEIEVLQHRLSALEALVARDEEVLRKLLALLVEKRVATRDEILERLK
jgi:type IV pilus assembly protein PilB